MGRPSTLGELRETGYKVLSVKEEMRRNLIAKIRTGDELFPGIVGYEETVIPQLENAVLSGQDIVLLGERGQAKTRIARSLVNLLDEQVPVLAGSEINDDPFHPVSQQGRALVAEQGDKAPIEWIARTQRYGEKLATPDITIADLIGEVDPIKVAEGRYLSDELTIHYGLLPRTNRGIFCLNELPDLAERIQVGLLNIMEERDVQIRGYKVRLELDLFVVASANPEDYTNRGRIITPLKDRFGAEIRTHYPIELADEVAVIRQEAQFTAEVPDALIEILARFTRALRQSSAVDQRSGVSARFAIAGAETISAAAVHRAARQGEEHPVARPIDLETAVDVLGGKIEFENGEEDRADEVLEHLLRTATAETVRSRFRGIDFGVLVEALDGGTMVTTGEQVSARAFLEGLPSIGESDVYDQVCERLGATDDGERAGAIELALEGLFLARRISKESGGGEAVYG